MVAEPVPDEPQSITFGFRNGTRIPPGVTAQAVLAEHEKYATTHVRVEIAEVAEEVLAKPQEYPALRSFAPATAEEALRRAMRDAVKYAFGAVEARVRVVNQPSGKQKPIYSTVRAIVPVEGADGKANWQRLERVAANPKWRADFSLVLRRQLDSLYRNLHSFLDEVTFLSENPGDSAG